MALSNSIHPTRMFKHIGVADVLVHLAKPQLHYMFTHFRSGFLINRICDVGLQSATYIVENVGGDDGWRVALDCREEAWLLAGLFDLQCFGLHVTVGIGD